MSKPNYSSLFRGLDPIATTIVFTLAIIGWLMIYGVGYGDGYPDSIPQFLKTEAGKQGIFLMGSLIIFFLILVIDWKFWRTFSNPIYIGSMIILLLVLFFGTEIKGARSWFHLFGFSLQPSELAKFGTCLILSDYLSRVKITSSLKSGLIYGLALIFAPICLILLQPDAGSALVFFSFILLLYRNGLPGIYPLIAAVLIGFSLMGIVASLSTIVFVVLTMGNIVMGYNMKNQTFWLISALIVTIASIVIISLDLRIEAIIASAGFFVICAVTHIVEKTFHFSVGLISLMLCGFLFAFSASYGFNNLLKPHQQDRINVWLQPDKADVYGSAYNLFQSKVAIGSGGISGKGYLEGSMTRLNYIPEQTTDFIFSSIGEEFGFIGCLILILLFTGLLWRIIIMAENQRNDFSRNYAYGVAGILFFHVMVNIGMTMGLFPVIGIPLPFISYGGSSLLGFTLMIGVLLKLDKHHKSS